MPDAREQREIELREQVERALRELAEAVPQQRESAQQKLETALDAFNQFLLEGRSGQKRDDDRTG